MTGHDAKLADFTSGFSKIAHVWSDALSDVGGRYGGYFGAGGGSGHSHRGFVLDKSAQASGEPQSVPLSNEVDASKVKPAP